MKLFILLGMLALLNGCASPTVFLTTERLAKNERSELITALSENGFKVEPTSGVRIPEEFADVVVATNPANENLEFFSKLERIIQQQNLEPISYQKFYQQKHYYKGRNVGLYVRGDQAELILPPVLRANEETCNDQRIILEFKSENRVNLDIEGDEITSYAGSYYSEPPNTVYAEFEGFENRVVLLFSEVSVETYAGMKTADRLVITSMGNEELPKGCEFMIIHY